MFAPLLGLLIAAPEAPANPPFSVVYQPATPWHLDLAPSMCTIDRSMAGAGKSFFIGVRALPPSSEVQILFRAAPVRWADKEQVTLTFDAGLSIKAIVSGDGQGLAHEPLFNLTISRGDAAELLAAKQLTVLTRRAKLIMALSGSHAVAEAFDKCELDLLTGWKIDPTEVTTSITRGSPRGTSWMTNDDYPRQALANKEQGTVIVVFHVGLEGKASDCRVIETSGSEALNRATCDIIRRSWFGPGTDSSGQPASYWDRKTFYWKLPSR